MYIHVLVNSDRKAFPFAFPLSNYCELKVMHSFSGNDLNICKFLSPVATLLADLGNIKYFYFHQKKPG